MNNNANAPVPSGANSNAVAAATVGELVAMAFAHYGDTTAYIDSGNNYSFSDVDAAATALANRLAGMGIGKGERIAVIALNQIEWVVAFFAAARMGAVIVGMNVRYRETELDYMLEDSGASAVIALAEYGGFDYKAYFAGRRDKLPRLRHHLFAGAPGGAEALAFQAGLDGAAAWTRSAPASVPAAMAPVDPDDMLMIIYTSGTTGQPKGVGLSHRSALLAAQAQARHIMAAPDDLIQLANPLNHVGGITCGILTFLIGGGCCEMVPVFKAETVLEMMSRNPPTVISGVPTMLTLLMMHPRIDEVDLQRVRLIFSGGANADQTLLGKLGEKAPNARLMNLYGLTETSGAVVMTPWDAQRDELLRSIGKPLAGAEIRIVLTDGNTAQPGEPGELWVRGLGVVGGYVDTRRDGGTFDGEGWLHTGDLGYVDARGYVYLLGRSKDMYIQGGFNVYPAETESVICTHPGVLLVAGIGVPDPVLGEVGRYYVVRKPGSSLVEQEIVDYCKQRLADYKVPRQVVFRDALPTTPAGKIQKSVLRGE
ncbi:class I adenylate-forming enzyme family protein [Pseudoduganella namucuonensis]|uniref:Fatty-acyl-CoA synthase n=1 Tax=Pseudoduganella namucuonensis TaxID=1035707 RepID=A0A1I7LS38_9BURK|nr:AMP-binding protein [Pseudoduganella namucuonensis]SFV12380.1 fatty-acyl-CoA synthase [Pseudoduganella namucuonensis]